MNSLYNIAKYKRRESIEVSLAGFPLGGNNPIRIQTMSNVSTMDTELCVEQTKKIVDAGADYFRFTAQGVKEAVNLGIIKSMLMESSIDMPIIADIHFNPKAAYKALETVDKVRINPGNFVDGRFSEDSEDFFESQVKKLKDKFGEFVDKAKLLNKAIRIGVNHGSLSDRIVMKYGDTPEGMVQSALEYIYVCVEKDFKDVVISMKSSNVIVMTSAVRLLVKRLDELKLPAYPIHLGVTEAGEGEDGRIKSAIGIGSLLYDGIGDTIRVSLSEDPEREIPVAKFLRDYIQCHRDEVSEDSYEDLCHISSDYESLIKGDRDRCIEKNTLLTNMPVCVLHNNIDKSINLFPDYLLRDDKLYDIQNNRYLNADFVVLRTKETLHYDKSELEHKIIVLDATGDPDPVYSWRKVFIDIRKKNIYSPIILKRRYDTKSIDDLRIMASVDFGTILLDGWGNGIMIENDNVSFNDLMSLHFGILQATRIRITHTEFISCPGCGRTLFDLQATVAEIKKTTSHLKGLKIGVMGCIVNGPGEMADADYGYVGSLPGKVDLYKGQKCIIKGVSQDIAKDTLVELIKDNGDWVDQ